MEQASNPNISDQPNVVVVIPCYKVSRQIMD